MRATLLIGWLVVSACGVQAAEPLLVPPALAPANDGPVGRAPLAIVAAPACPAVPRGRPEFPPPKPCCHCSYLAYRANYFGYGSFDYRRLFDYPTHPNYGYCVPMPVAAPRLMPHEPVPTPAGEFPAGAARRMTRR